MLKYLFLPIFILLSSISTLLAEDAAIVLRVIDGDTLKAGYDHQKVNIRLIGIDTPESRANKKAYRDAKRSGKDKYGRL